MAFANELNLVDAVTAPVEPLTVPDSTFLGVEIFVVADIFAEPFQWSFKTDVMDKYLTARVPCW